MKNLKLSTLAFLLLAVGISYGQVYNMANGNDTTCSGTFYDSGGLGLYGANQNLTKTFCGNTPGSVVQVRFTTFMTEVALDQLCIYDGPTTASPLIGCYSGNGTLNGITFKSTTGCLTFNFTSNATTQLNGWAATISCSFACQTVVANGSNITPLPDTAGILRICRGSAVTLNGGASYPQSGTYYNQSNTTSTFTWKTGDGFSIAGQNTTHTFNTPGIFDINLIVADTIGCKDTAKSARVIVSDAPNFRNVSYFPNDTICLGDTAVMVIPDTGLFTPFNPPVLNAAGVTFLPDGTGVSYRDTIPVSIFSPAATFQSGFLHGIYVNMEHSYLGDLQINITCPNGQTAILKQYPGGGGTHLGEAVDPFVTPVPLNPGVGYTYEFTNLSPRYSTMNNEAGVYQHNYTDVLGNAYTAQNYLPAGTYTPFQNLTTQLTGCPLNGNWVITVTDNLAIDNGYIFFWGLNFDTLIRPPSVVSTITGVRDSSLWTSTSRILATPGDTTIVTSPLTSGTHQFNYRIFDNFGCIHDTLIDLYVKPKPKSNAGIDFTTCRLDYQLSPVPTAGSSSNKWSYYSNSLTGSSIISDDTVYTPTTTVNEFSQFYYVLEEVVDGCPTYPDTVEITHIRLLNTIDIGIDKDTICIPELVTFTNNSDMTFFDSIYWDFGDGNTSNAQGGTNSHSYTTPNCYNLKVTLVNRLGCKVDSTLPTLICAFPVPVANFTYNPFEPIVPETLINFSNTTIGATSYVWDFAGLGTSTNQDDSYEFPKTEGGQYPVTLTVTNEGGCTDQITKVITIKNPLSIWIPNTFTPNGDGLNETFRVYFNNSSVTSYSIQIFNRWGETLFSSEDPDFEWDGKYKGENVPNGTYIWKITGKEEFETESFTKIGHVTVTR